MATQLAARCGGFRLLPSVRALQWDAAALGDSLPCPDAYDAGEYGEYVDCVIRHLLAGPGEFRDPFAEAILRTRGEHAPRVRRAYSRVRGSHATATVLAALLAVSKAKSAFITLRWRASRFSASIGAVWFARLARMLAACVPNEPAARTYVGVRHAERDGAGIYGEPDALVGTTVVEFKASNTMQCSGEWKCRTLVHAALLRRNGARITEARIIDVSVGVCLRVDLAAWSEHETLAWASQATRRGAANGA